jgi:hypothetical protein
LPAFARTSILLSAFCQALPSKVFICNPRAAELPDWPLSLKQYAVFAVLFAKKNSKFKPALATAIR